VARPIGPNGEDYTGGGTGGTSDDDEDGEDNSPNYTPFNGSRTRHLVFGTGWAASICLLGALLIDVTALF
jgi:hypothetical protein